MTIERREPITPKTDRVVVRITAEKEFSPRTINLETLRCGAPGTVNKGGGLHACESANDGDDLLVTFAGTGHGITATDYVAKWRG